MPAVLLAAALAALYLALDPRSSDLAAQLYRAGLADRGVLLWDNGWYAGHHLPGYSVLFPQLGALVGVRVVAALAIVGATAAFWRVSRSHGAAAWFAVSMAAAVVSGRLAFALGAALGAAAVLAAARRRPALAALAGAATALASPVAALFLALVAAAWAYARGPRAVWAMGAGAVVAGGVIGLAFPEGGSEPFAASSFWPALAATALGLAIVPRRAHALRAGLVAYALLLIAAFAIPTPMGGNAARLGALLAGPVAVAALWPRRAPLLALLVLPLAYWTLYPPVRDWAQAAGDPSTTAAYYRPLVAELGRRDAGRPPARVEVPFTARHWESYEVARHVPLARGWERQLDRRDDPPFYEGRLTAARYRRWLDALAVRWVALPDAPLDHAGRAEAALVRAGLPYLRQVWRSAHWRLYAVRHPAPLGATALGADWFATRGGLVRVRWSPYWAITRGRGCLRRAPGGWTDVTPAPGATSTGARRTTPVRVAMRFSIWRVLAHGPRCR